MSCTKEILQMRIQGRISNPFPFPIKIQILINKYDYSSLNLLIRINKTLPYPNI